MNQNGAICDEIITRVQMARYILDKLDGKCNSLKLIKLIALADIYKLRLDGETITGDKYIALKNGPAPSVTSDIIGFDGEWIDSAILEYAGEYIEKCNTEVSAKEKDIEYHHLSEFDKKCIDCVIDKYGHLSKEDLIEGNSGENVHAFEAWRKHNIKEYGAGQSAKINLEDFFNNDGPVQVGKKDIQRAKERYLYGDL